MGDPFVFIEKEAAIRMLYEKVASLERELESERRKVKRPKRKLEILQSLDIDGTRS